MTENVLPLVMQDTAFKYNHLKTINGVKFTPREIDVIACLLSGRGAKTIAQFLSIEEKTVETHKYNVMRKLDTNFKEGIIEFAEKSEKYLALKNHYLGLLREVVFAKYLQRISTLTRNLKVSSALVHEGDKNELNLCKRITTHLKLAGIEAYDTGRDVHKAINQHNNLQDVNHVIYLASSSFPKNTNTDNDQIANEFIELLKQLTQDKGKMFLLAQRHDLSGDTSFLKSGINLIDYSKQEDYHVVFCKVIQALLPNVYVDRLTEEFLAQYKNISDSTTFDQPVVDHNIPHNYLETSNQNNNTSLFSLSNKRNLLIRSDLVIPTESTIVYRNALMSQIHSFLDGNMSIQTIALVGIGGVGKTTVARQYARNQGESVIWEVNAETRENLNSSFENLAFALSETDDEKRMLRGLQEIVSPSDREDKIIFFVKNKLKSQEGWFLIYDNVEKFADIQKYFPFSIETWGKGKVIITSRDSNIQYNSHIKATITIAALELNDRVNLFRNIMLHGSGVDQADSHAEQIEEFLEHIPPFPLDVSIAAYYLKMTNQTYNNYIAHLKEYNKDLDAMQRDLIMEATQYAKTRYSIITLSLNCFLKTNQEFEELLLLISLMDSQNIPKDIMTCYKSEIVVDNFIFCLRKYSLTVCSPTDKLNSIPNLTIHRSTQEISLNYLTQKMNLLKSPSPIRVITRILENYSSKILDTVDLNKIKNLQLHCEAFLGRDNLLSMDVKAILEGILGGIHYTLGNYASAQTFLENSLQNFNHNDNNNLARVAKDFVYMGMVYRKLGHYEKAKGMIEQSLEIYKKDFPDNHLEIAWALTNLGVIFRHLGNYVNAKLFTAEGLEIYERFFDKNYIGKGWALSNLGSVYRNLGQFNKAQELMEQSLLIYQSNLPDNHPEIAGVLEQLADTHRNLGQYSEAENLLNRCLKIYEEQYGKEHLEIAWILIHLGKVYRDAGYLNNSKGFQVQKINGIKLSNKNKPKEIHQTQNNNTQDLNLNYYYKAKELLEGGLKTFEKQFGKDHTSTARILVYLSGFHVDTGNLEEAESLLKQGLNIYISNFGEKHLKTACAFRSLGEVYLLKGEFEAAKTYVNKGLMIFQQYNHPECFKAMENMGEIKLKESLSAENRHKARFYKTQALDYLKQALRIVQAQFPPDSLQLRRIQAKIEGFKQHK